MGLTARFGIETISVRFLGIWRRSLRIGIREAHLVFHLSDATMPDEDWAIDDKLPPSRTITRTRTIEGTASAEREWGTEAAVDIKSNTSVVAGLIEAGMKIGGNQKEKQLGSQKVVSTDAYEFDRHLVVSSGGPGGPTWTVRSLDGIEALQGTAIAMPYFARVVPSGKNPRVELTLEIPRSGILVEDETGAFQGVNRRTIARRRIEKALCDSSISLDGFDLPAPAEKAR